MKRPSRLPPLRVKRKMAYVVGKIMEGYGIKGCDVLITGDKITPADDAYEKKN